MVIRKGSRGVDVAQRTNKKQWKSLKKAGWDWAVVRGFNSRDKPDANAARSLKSARAAGYKRRQLGVYFYPCAKCGHPKKQLHAMIKQLKNQGVHKHFSTIWLDIEGSWPNGKLTKKQIAAKKAAAAAAKKKAAAAPKPAVAGSQVPTKKGGKKGKKQPKTPRDQYTDSRSFFRSLLRACRKLKRYECGVYTTGKDWTRIMGSRPMAVLNTKNIAHRCGIRMSKSFRLRIRKTLNRLEDGRKRGPNSTHRTKTSVVLKWT